MSVGLTPTQLWESLPGGVKAPQEHFFIPVQLQHVTVYSTHFLKREVGEDRTRDSVVSKVFATIELTGLRSYMRRTPPHIYTTDICVGRHRYLAIRYTTLLSHTQSGMTCVKDGRAHFLVR